VPHLCVPEAVDVDVDIERARERRRLHLLHDVYAGAGRRALVAAGLGPGMAVADFGCGLGLTTRMLADLIGPRGTVTGIDRDPVLLHQAEQHRTANVSFVRRDVCRTGLPCESFDLVYCRLLLLHLPHPMDCLGEMRRLLRPGGILVVEESDLTTAMSVPPTDIDDFGELFARFAPTLGLDLSGARRLDRTVQSAGFADVHLERHQPALPPGEHRMLLKWNVEEAAAAFLDAGIVTHDALSRTLRNMQEAIDDPGVVILAPQMSIAWGRKPLP